MRIQLISIGTKMPAWITAGFEDYASRMPSHLPLQLVEIPMPKRTKSSNIDSLKQQEGELILKASGKQAYNVALDLKGQSWDTRQLAKQLQAWQLQGCPLNLWIGGPDGYSDQCLQSANERWCLSPLTLPHPLVRVIVAEQLYRASSLLANHPYHR